MGCGLTTYRGAFPRKALFLRFVIPSAALLVIFGSRESRSCSQMAHVNIAFQLNGRMGLSHLGFAAARAGFEPDVKERVELVDTQGVGRSTA